MLYANYIIVSLHVLLFMPVLICDWRRRRWAGYSERGLNFTMETATESTSTSLSIG